MSRFPGGSISQGDIFGKDDHPATWWRCPANSLAGPTALAVGSGVVVDGFEAGGATLYGGANTYSLGAGSDGLRATVGGAPHYGLNAGVDTPGGYSCVFGNVICPDTVPHARDHFGVYKGVNQTQGTRGATLAAGETGVFQWSGMAQCLVSITTSLDQALTLEESVANSRAGTLRAAVAGEQIHAIAREIKVGTATAPVLCWVEIVPGRGPTLNA